MEHYEGHPQEAVKMGWIDGQKTVQQLWKDCRNVQGLSYEKKPKNKTSPPKSPQTIWQNVLRPMEKVLVLIPKDMFCAKHESVSSREHYTHGEAW